MPSFSIEGARLTVVGHLELSDEDPFREHCLQIQATDADLLEVDLRDVDSINSGCIGILVSVVYHQVSRERRMKVDASPAVQKVLDMTGVAAVLKQARGDDS